MGIVLRRSALLVLTLALAWTLTDRPLAQRAPAQATAPPATLALPDKLSDTAFWKLIADYSEPNGYFQSDNFVSNELSLQWVIPDLQKVVKPGGVYMGVGPDQNFFYIGALRPQIAFIVDIRRGNLLQLLMYKAIMELSADRAEFAAKLFARAKPATLKADASADAVLAAVHTLPADRTLYEKNLKAITDHLVVTHGFPLTIEEIRGLEYIYGSFFSYGPGIRYSNSGNSSTYPTYWDMQVTDDNRGKNWGYLASEEQFRVLKRMEEANLIVPLTGNFGGDKAIRSVGGWVRAHGAVVTTFYTSNVEQYLFQDGIWGNYYRNVGSVPLDSTSQFIRSVFNGAGGYGFSGGLRSAQLTSPILELLAAFTAGKINNYYDVIGMSR